ncbi:MAG TPA: amino acid adenylation domain-containing protein [Solirubrobacteraceae bacterium]|nr:amino acid adenylation domain-containing protein [Solirubrobacteraceae bacterium]
MQSDPVEVGSAQTVLSASFAQQRMWFLERFEGGALYNVPLVTRLRGPLDVSALEAAFDALVERHETLRTVFTLVDGAPHQVIRPPGPFTLEQVDVDGSEERALSLAAEQARRPFELSSEAPIRALLVRLDAEDHVLAITLHHIVTDGWSMGVLSRELTELYGQARAGTTPELPELAIQYADYAAWQQEWMDSGGLDHQLEHWKRSLAGVPPLLELPTDRPRPSRQSFRGATERVMLPVELLGRVRAFGEGEGATTFMTLLAVFAALLSRYSGQEDVVVASPVANRNRVEFERVIGLFVNTLALRVDVSSEPSFHELLARVREMALGAFSNQDVPFEKLVAELRPERHLSHAPLAQVMFVVLNARERPAPMLGLESERLMTDRGTAKFDLTLFATETPDGLRLSLEYCTDLFERSTALRMLEHYRVLLEAALNEPDRPVGELRLLGEDEEELILHRWNETDVEVPAELARPVPELIAAQVAATPDAPAVVFGERTLSYRELDARANQVARHLVAQGAEPGAVVAICAERSIEMVIAVLGVLKAGCAYAPIDPGYPEDRVEFMLSDTSAPVLVTQSHLLERLPAGLGAAIVCLDSDASAIAARDSAPVEPAATLDDLAYVIFTSGSTGRPKGVAMPHRTLANLLAWQRSCWAPYSADPDAPAAAARTLQFASLSFDVAFQELFCTWSVGGTLVLVADEVRRDPEALLAYLAEQRVQRLFLPFVALHNLCEAAGYLSTSVPSLREVITAGEQLKATGALRAFFAHHPGCRLVNQYGPTESHVVSAYTLTGEPDLWPPLPPIGRPISGSRLYLLDRHLQPVPVGVPGELYIGGMTLARGYLARPELTAERFIADPFADGRLYRTGDLARYLPDGNIEYLGRADHQVKIRGFRVEPGEVEAALRTHPAVGEAFVMAREDAGERRLVAYLIPSNGAIDSDELRAHLRRSLPEYMVPSAVMNLESFPLTPNGKVDRARLAELPLEGQQGERVRKPPRTGTEHALAAIWSRVLGVEELGVTDNFFDLGGHSLMAVRLFAEIERRMSVRLPLSALFETATIEGLAKLVDADRRGEEDVEWSTMVRMRSGDGELPLFLIGWAGGEVLPYRDLVENLDATVPVFGLRAPGVDRIGSPQHTVAGLASHYVSEIRKVQSQGPYRLGGFCFSGLVAYEMARQLQAEGETVSTLALIDAYPYRTPRRRSAATAGRAQLAAFRAAGRDGRKQWLRDRLAGLHGRAHRLVYLKAGPRLYELLARRGLERLMPRRPWNLVLVASNLARRHYVPEPLDTRIEFYRAQRGPDDAPTPWEDLAMGGVALRPIVHPGISHDGMMHEPHVRMLAEALSDDLQAGVRDLG